MARKDSLLAVMAIKGFPSRLSKGTNTLISGVLPLLEIQIITSLGWIIPKSPWIASAACIKREGVPVEFIVATIFCAIIALFPMPVTTTLPPLSRIVWTERAKSLSKKFVNFPKEYSSVSMVSRAKSSILLKFSKIVIFRFAT